MFVLHYIFLPRINNTVDHFIVGWNKHPLRTEKNWSPEKLWTNGMMKRGLNEIAENPDTFINEDLVWYGYDPNAPHPSEIETTDVVVDDCNCPFSFEV